MAAGCGTDPLRSRIGVDDSRPWPPADRARTWSGRPFSGALAASTARERSGRDPAGHHVSRRWRAVASDLRRSAPCHSPVPGWRLRARGADRRSRVSVSPRSLGGKPPLSTGRSGFPEWAGPAAVTCPAGAECRSSRRSSGPPSNIRPRPGRAPGGWTGTDLRWPHRHRGHVRTVG
jgi:hypothetical protein